MDANSILRAMDDVTKNGILRSPRDQKTLEILNYQFVVDQPFSSFAAREFDMGYCAKEMLWYLEGNPHNDEILKASKVWKRFRQPEGNWFSCYGQYWFNTLTRDGLSGVDWVVAQLTKDLDSRQAIIPMLQPKHLFEGNTDVVCTSYVNFHIRDGKLNMTVRMRSSDIIWGYGNDLPCFWWLHEIVGAKLGIECGTYTHSSDSLHVYEKHFEMIHCIVQDGMEQFVPVKYPKIEKDLRPFIQWLKEQ